MSVNHTDLAQHLGFAVTRLNADSRSLRPGDTFAAYPGESADGRKFIAQAIASGANGVIWEPQDFIWPTEWRVPNYAIAGLREQLGHVASEVYGRPSQHLWVIGITGTNGKTSVAHWLAQSFNYLGRKTALMGTLGNGFPGALMPTANTTPNAISVQERLRDFFEADASAVAMEVSSHGLTQGRVNGVAFDVAILTNLSRDHLDYHGNMAAYENAKALLFSWPELRYAILNKDDQFGAKLTSSLASSAVEVVTYGTQGNVDVTARDVIANANGISMNVITPWGTGKLKSHVIGRFNISNSLATLATLLVSGIAFDDALNALALISPVPGRMQTLGGNYEPLVVVDYAHTPDALEKVLNTLLEILPPAANLICVFGCGGNRDRGKRSLMGEVATRLATHTIVTSDNPRQEDPRTIIDQIILGAGQNYEVIVDRASAINAAIKQAKQSDIVLIAGKGHEQYQEVNGKKQPFDDLSEASAALTLRGLN